MSVHIPQWIFAAFVGAAPMLGIVFLILFSCTLLGLVQRCKINLAKNYANRRRNLEQNRFSFDDENPLSFVAFKPGSSLVIISPFDDIPMKDIDADSTSRAYSLAKDGKITGSFFFFVVFFLFVGRGERFSQFFRSI